MALADADNQKSARQWLKQRPEQVAHIQSLRLAHEKSIGEVPKNIRIFNYGCAGWRCLVSMPNSWSVSACDCDATATLVF